MVLPVHTLHIYVCESIAVMVAEGRRTMGTERTDEELDELLDFYSGLEEHWGWEEAVRMLAAFDPDPAIVRKVQRRAYARSDAAQEDTKSDEERPFLDAGNALAELADRVEKDRRR